MATSNRTDVMLAQSTVLRPGTIEKLNDILDRAGIGRALRCPELDPEDGPCQLVELPVEGADPEAVRAVLRLAAAEWKEDFPELVPSHRSVADTVENGAKDTPLWHYGAAGKESGHGTIAWLPAPKYAMCRPERPTVAFAHRPVIALLDTKCRPHSWLTDLDDPFIIPADGWRPRVCIPRPAPNPDPSRPNLGSRYGHGTFNAGLIRLAAPNVRVMPVRVMSDDGDVIDENAIKALQWLADPTCSVVPIDVVCMPFGRPSADGKDKDLAALREAIMALKQRYPHIVVVASAGNHGIDEPTYPAAFAGDPALPVVSVGGKVSSTQRAPFSNHGVWVTRWETCTDVISLMPVTTSEPEPVDSYVWWSGTSFAAARVAAAIAERRVGARHATDARTGP